MHYARKPASALLSLAILAALLTSPAPAFSQQPERVWGTRPLLSYFALTASLEGLLRRGAGLDAAQFEIVEQAAYRESASLDELLHESQAALAGAAPLWWKRLLIARMGYNRRVEAILAASNAALRQSLDAGTYQRLVTWIEARWQVERQLHASQPALAAGSNPRTYQVFATRYDSRGAYTVALPDKCVKFTNGGNRICESDGYVVGVKYQVFITYQKSVGVLVSESGPWNVDDAYWAKWNDPTPRRMFGDVGLGIPEAQAAFFNGYNGGKDQFGRKVTGPYGIDLARQVSVDIGLQPGKNDWVTVTFQWTAGWDNAAGTGGTPLPVGTGAAGATAQAIVPVEVAAPQPDGSIIHTVLSGQTLWDIASAYQITLRTLYTQNNLTEKSVIWPGDKLLIRPAGPTPTGDLLSATSEPSSTPQPTGDATGTSLAMFDLGTQSVQTVAAQIYIQQTQAAQPQTAAPAGASPNFWLVASLIILVLGIVLFLVGRMLR